MRLFLGCAFLMFCSLTTQISQAAIVFTLTPATQSVAAGTDLTFDVRFSSNAGPATINSIDFNLLAGLGDGSGGVFTSATSSLAGFSFDFSTTGQAFLASNVDVVVDGTGVAGSDVYATLVLDTTGLAAGDYFLSFDGGTVGVASTPAGVLGIAGAPAQYTIVTAVPEPTSMALVGLIGGVVGFRRWRKIRSKS